MYIARCIDAVEELFPSDSHWQELHLDEAKCDFVDFNDLLQKFLELKNRCFENFNLALLSGEYISDENFLDNLQALDGFIASLYLDYNGECLEFQTLGRDVIEQITRPLRSVLVRLEHFHKNTENKILGFRKESFLYSKKLINKNGDILSIDVEKDIKFLEINFRLCSIDRNLEVTKKVYESIVLVINELDKLFSSHYLQKPLLDKAYFLQKKLDFRLKDDDLTYEINFQEITPPDSIPVFNNWLKLIAEHYEEYGRESTRFKSNIRELSGLGFKKKYEDYQKLIKSYKDDGNEDESIKFNLIRRLIQQFKEHFGDDNFEVETNLRSVFDQRAYFVTLNYFYNYLLSLAAKQNSVKDFEMFELFDSIVQFQHEKGLNNFFHFEKISEFYILRLENFFNQEKKNIQEIQACLNTLSKNLKEAERNYEWCENRNYLIYQLPFDECIIPYELDEVTTFPLFIFSSFVLPLNYDLEKSRLKDLRESKRKFELLLDFYKNIEPEIKIIERNKAWIENSERKNIEILSIFSAVVLFSIGELQVFQKLDGKQLYQFSLVFAYCLILFVVVIWLITRDYPVTRKLKLPTPHYYIIGFLVLSTLVIFWKAFDW